MVIILNLGGKASNEFTTEISNQYLVTSFFHRVLGNNNDIHDRFSDYAISSIQGGKLSNGQIQFLKGGSVNISTPNANFLDNFMPLLYMHINKEIYTGSGIYLKGIGVSDFSVGEYFDKIQTISPIRLKNDNDCEITFLDTEFMDTLTNKMVAKLRKFDPSLNLSKFKIEAFKIENSKQKSVCVKKGVYTKCSYMRFIVRGTMEARRAAYLMGFGQSTGCGFGSVKVMDK